MGSQHKKKKGNKDVRTVINDMKREADMTASRTAIQPRFEIGYSPLGTSTMDWVHVTDSIDTSQQTVTAPFNTTTLNLWLKLNGNYRDYSNELNVIYPHIAQKNKAFILGGPRSAAWGANFNWPTRYSENSLHLAGQDYLLFPDSTPIQLDFVSGFSFWMWIYPRVLPGGTSMLLFCKRTDASNYCECFISNVTGSIQADFNVVEAGVAVKVKNNISGNAIALNAWNSIGCTYDGAVAQIYRNKTIGIASTGGVVVPGSSRLSIGGCEALEFDSVTRGFQGGIAEVMYVKSLALSQTNINNLHDNGIY